MLKTFNIYTGMSGKQTTKKLKISIESQSFSIKINSEI